MKEKFSLVIPTYNEAENIEDLCAQTIKILSEHDIDFELIVVDDDSPDGTWQIVENLSKNNKAIKAILRKREKGLGSAVVRGWNEAAGEIFGVIDGDFQHPPEVIPYMIKALSRDKDLDIVVASRNVPGGGVSRWTLWRRFISWAGALVSAFFLPEILAKVRDPMSGYFILRKEVVQDKILTPMGYKILLEVLAKGNYKKVREFPYYFKERKSGGSKAGFRLYLATLAYICRLSVQTGEIYRVIKYAGVGLLGALVTFSSYLFGIRLGLGYVFSYALGLELAIMNNFILNELWTFRDKSRADPVLRSRIKRLIDFNLICFYGAAISFLTFLFLIRIINLKPIYAVPMALSLSYVWNFIASTNLVWLSKFSQIKYKIDVEEGYYHRVLENNKIQRYWHCKKFEIISKSPFAAPILDIGSGPGVFLCFYHNIKGLKVNLDYSYIQLRYGKALDRTASYVNASGSNLPFSDNSFSTVYLIETTEHLEEGEIKTVLSEVFRVLKKEGRAVISTPNYKSLWPLFEIIISRLGPVNYRIQHITHFDMEKLTRCVESSGFIIKSKGTFFILSPFFSIISKQVSDFLLNIERKLFPKRGSIILIEATKV